MSERPLLSSSCRGNATGRTTARSAPNTTTAGRIDPDLAGSFPSRAQLHRWLTGSIRSLPYPDHCRVLEEMLPGWTAEQLFQPASPERSMSGRIPSPRTKPGAVGPPVFAAPSIRMRPFIEHAFAAEHVTIDFATASGLPPGRPCT